MSYVKKDEDADQVMIKLDRTSVFQDGRIPQPVNLLFIDRTQLDYSTPHPYHRENAVLF